MESDGKPRTKDIVINLSLIDPESIKWYVDDILDNDAGTLLLVATDDKKNIVETMEGEKDDKPYLTDREYISFIGPDYAGRFAKAFVNAVKLCGGKPSTF